MSHITVIKTRLHNIEAIRSWAKKLNIEMLNNALVRYWAGATKKYQYCLKCPGKYDIGINLEPDGSLTISADWSYADFYKHFGVTNRAELIKMIEEGHNEEIFRHTMRTKYRIQDRDIVTNVNKVTGKKILEVVIRN